VLITASAKGLASAARTAAEMSARDSSVPIRTNLLMVARNGCVAFTGTDSIGSMTATAKAETAKAGCVAVDGKVVKLLAEFADGAVVEISTVDGAVNVRCGRARYRVDTLPADEFPAPLKESKAAEITISDADRRRLFMTPAVAISTDELVRPSYCGLSLKSAGGRLVACATDGHQLIKTSVACDAALPAQGAIVPRQACAAIAKFDGCAIRVGARLIEAKTNARHFVHRLVEGIFPAYEHVILVPSGNTVEIDRRELIAALNRLLLVAAKGEGLGSVAALDWGDNELRLFVSRQKDVASDALPAVTCGRGKTGLVMGIAIKLLGAFSAEKVTLDASDLRSPVRITLVGDNDLVALQMPCRVNEWAAAEAAA
jgi:DNA polymerase III subunit beta